MVRRAAAGLVLAATGVLAACGPGAGGGGGGGAASPLSGSRATDFTARDIDGKTVRLSDYMGKQAVLLDFCATYCQPCVAEIPHLRRIYDRDKSKGFVVLAVAMDPPETVASVPGWARSHGMTFPVLLDEDSHVAAIYNPKKSAPLTVLIDKKGDVVYVHDGYNPGDEVALEEHIAKALDPAAASK